MQAGVFGTNSLKSPGRRNALCSTWPPVKREVPKWISDNGVVVVCLPRPVEGRGRLKFSDLLTELPVPPLAARFVGTF